MATSPGLTKRRIVMAGLEVLDERGLDGLTVRAVAERLTVQAPALYWHVKNKQDLLDEMSTELWRDIFAIVQKESADAPWQQGMVTFANAMRSTLLAHRDGAKVFSGTYLTDTSILANQETSLQRMLADGFSLKDALRASALVYNFTIGFCIEEQSVAQSRATGDDRYSPERRSGRFDPEANPLIIESGSEIFGDQDERFSGMVAMLIGAAERLRA